MSEKTFFSIQLFDVSCRRPNDTTNSVSYTHLDVYKRQEVCCPLFVKQVLRQFPAISEPCMPSTFLKTVLIAVAIHKNASAKTTHSKKNCLKNVAKSALLPHDDYSVHCALDYLESEKMVTWLDYENRYCLAATPVSYTHLGELCYLYNMPAKPFCQIGLMNFAFAVLKGLLRERQIAHTWK